MKFPNIGIIREYLSEEFAGLPIEDADDFDLHAHRFKVIEENQTCLLKISNEFALDTDAETLKKLLHNENIGSLMRNPEFNYILISSNGIVPFKNE